jgi:hypothetical protein
MDILYQLIDVYFVEWETYGPLLHRPSFEKSISEGLHHRDTAFGAVVLAVCAIGAKTSATPLEDNPGDRWIRQVHLEQFVFGQTLELYHVQLCCV